MEALLEYTREPPQSKKEIKPLNFYRSSTPHTDIRPAKHEALSEQWEEASKDIYIYHFKKKNRNKINKV
jgi:hypothetical protein